MGIDIVSFDLFGHSVTEAVYGSVIVGGIAGYGSVLYLIPGIVLPCLCDFPEQERLLLFWIIQLMPKPFRISVVNVVTACFVRVASLVSSVFTKGLHGSIVNLLSGHKYLLDYCGGI